ncbi:MAG: glycine/sarcosine/betaine reductase selenoprotein B family protein [Chloroflexota bacterium]|nr:glycine/sarcosine/betaine reductase selenoprotein B family protein [Chloroflexota bacterium]
MPRLETLSEVQRRTLEFFPCQEHESTPWVRPGKPLSQCKVALVTSAGLHLRNDQPFTRDDPGGEYSYRVIPSDCDPADVVQSHFSIGFDHTGIYRDLNVTFPVDRLRELVSSGEVGALSTSFYSFMGALRDASGVIEETGPEVAARLKDEGVDVVLLTPT